MARLNVERANVNLEGYAIRSPARGVVTLIHKQRGEGVRRLEPVVQIEVATGP